MPQQQYAKEAAEKAASEAARPKRKSATSGRCGRSVQGDIDEWAWVLQIVGEIGVVIAVILSVAFGIATLNLCLDNGEAIKEVVRTAWGWLMSFTIAFWQTVFFVVKMPFVLGGWVMMPFAALSGGTGKGGAVAAPDVAVGNTSPQIPITNLPAISTLQSVITSWSSLPPYHSPLNSECSHTTIIDSSTSPTGKFYLTSHTRGNKVFKLQSAYPFTRHNNSLPAADRCEWSARGFGEYWGEEMQEKMGEGPLAGPLAGERFDLSLGNALARVLVKECKIPISEAASEDGEREKEKEKLEENTEEKKAEEEETREKKEEEKEKRGPTVIRMIVISGGPRIEIRE